MSIPIEKFYTQFGGDRLVDSHNYPPEINQYLRHEERLIFQIITTHGYDYLIEVGCMDARALPITLALDISYYGVDIVDKYIKEAQAKIKLATQRHPSLIAEAYCVSIYDLASCFQAHPLQINPNLSLNPLAIFPFNSFGNIEDPEKAARAVSDCGLDFLILTYRTDDYSTKVRKAYYQNCGYTGITTLNDERGIRFISSEGLNTVAYEENYIKTLLGINFSIQEYPIAQVGVGYHGTRIV